MEGSRADIRVPMREISQSETPTAFGGENPPVFVYDTSGPWPRHHPANVNHPETEPMIIGRNSW